MSIGEILGQFSAADFNEVIHAPKRLTICAYLSVVDTMEFSALREILGLSESALSKHLATLSAESYVQVSKISRAGRTRTTVRLTGKGRSAYSRHVAALRALLRE